MTAVDQAAPERVFIVWPSDNGCGLAFTVPSKSGQMRTEYIRADLAAPSAQPVAWQFRAMENGQPRTGWHMAGTNDHASWVELARRDATCSVEDRPIFATPAPAEVEGLTDAQKIKRIADLNWKPASQYWKEQHDAKGTALTALQADNDRLRNWQDHNANEAPRLQMRLDAANARAEKAEAERDAWKANAGSLATQLRGFSSEYDWSDEDTAALAAHAKLKGEV